MAEAKLRLPSEIVEAILVLLPNDSIHPFRSVSKSWSSLLMIMLCLLNPVIIVEMKKLIPRKLPDPEGMAGGGYRAYGFGYDSVADDYKVFLAVRYWNDPHAPVVRFFSLKTGSWKSVENPNRHLHDLGEGDTGLFFNGALHWRKEYDAKITAFDLVKEKFGEVPAPSHPEELPLGYNGIGIVGEYLCMSWIPKPMFDARIVWVMKEYLNKESWVLFIDYSPLRTEQQCFVGYDCNFIADSVQDKEDGGCLMFYWPGDVRTTEILKWNKNLEKTDRGGEDEGDVKVKYYKHSASTPYREALTSPYPSLEENQGFSTLISKQGLN
ncbi:hypothetical protein Tsubulata_028332 [Turnera subulata]|uniref:F-box associated beta-propeller type 1 domain-containing protein n=1 Tax=Turnera subulata TaxID=218843 RepID=A0A9Q0G0P6_9ROSI|nr:hypothetical protein Tsubulata_028332 [Turnera subulata]